VDITNGILFLFIYAIIPVPDDTRNDEAVGDKIGNEQDCAYSSDVIIVWFCLVITETSKRIFPDA
jgi:hypothetical protein|tara:strand:- start:572 stop:766 length:195 start_codon:yes stop_codon:yes gene_type:complete